MTKWELKIVSIDLGWQDFFSVSYEVQDHFIFYQTKIIINFCTQILLKKRKGQLFTQINFVTIIWSTFSIIFRKKASVVSGKTYRQIKFYFPSKFDVIANEFTFRKHFETSSEEKL